MKSIFQMSIKTLNKQTFNQIYKSVIFILWLVHSTGFVYSKDVITFHDDTKIKNIGRLVSIFEDSTAKMNANQVFQTNNFVPSSTDAPNLGVTSSNHWILIKVNNTTKTTDLLLDFAYPIIDHVEFFEVIDSSNIKKLSELGEDQPFYSRKYKHPNFIFDLDVPHGVVKTYLLKINSGEQILVPLILGTSETIFYSLISKDIIFGIYIGVIIIMLLYNLFIYFTVRDKAYLYYVVYILFVGLTQTYLQGYTFKFLWPNSSWMAIHSMFLFPSFVGIAIAEFIKVFLQTSQYSKKLNWGLNIISTIYVICIILGISGLHNESQKIIDINAMLISLYGLFIAILLSIKGSRSARFFLFAWSIFLVGICVFILKNFGVLPYNNLTNYMMPLGSAIEVALLSFALADRITILRREKEQSQAQALDALKENERIIKEQNVLLESQVRIRTAELEQSNEELNVILDNLKSTQSQLVDAEKMASLGQLTAGIAHEINNPINFVTSNVSPLRRDIEDLVLILNKYAEIRPDGISAEKLEEVEKLKKELDVDFLVEEMDMLLSGIDEGASRTAEIIKGLRNFSRLDESELKKANINEGIESTLIVLNSAIAHEEVKLERNFGDLPDIECYPGKLNQLVMNIINNGIHATEMNPNSGKERIVKISTAVDGKDILISIADNGKGMDESTKSKIFDPFFTTKDVGEGTGLGLSIAFSIIESHNGQINVESKVGEGTTFNIRIPLERKS